MARPSRRRLREVLDTEWSVDAWEVAALEPNRFLALRGLIDLRGRNLDPKQPRPSAYVEGLWCFLLNELPDGRTRLVVSGYQTIRPRWIERFVNYWLYIPVTWIMQARTLVVLKRNIERAVRVRPHTVALQENPPVESKKLSETA